MQAHANSFKIIDEPAIISAAVETAGCKTGITRFPIKFLFKNVIK